MILVLTGMSGGVQVLPVFFFQKGLNFFFSKCSSWEGCAFFDPFYNSLPLFSFIHPSTLVLQDVHLVFSCFSVLYPI